jgi:hypothetical protein
VSLGGGLVGDGGVGVSRTQDAHVEALMVEEGGRHGAHVGVLTVD